MKTNRRSFVATIAGLAVAPLAAKHVHVGEFKAAAAYGSTTHRVAVRIANRHITVDEFRLNEETRRVIDEDLDA